MKLKMITVLILFWGCVGAQNWIQVGDLNWSGPRPMYYDSVSNLLVMSCQSLLNGADSINGIFTFDGTNIKPIVQERYDCGSVNCGPAAFLTRYGDYIYYSGPGMKRMNDAEVYGIGRWDGEEWSAGLPGLGGNDFDKRPYIDGYCLRDGKLYAGGFFRTAGGDTCNSVAYWDGNHWTGLNFPGEGSLFETPRVNHVFFYKDELYAAGNFYVYLDGEWVADIIRYDGSNWHAVGGGLHGGEANIWDWAIYQDELYVCGYFRDIDGNVGNKIMRWDGQNWKDVGGGVCSSGAVAQGLYVYDGKLLLGGIFNCVGNGLPVNNIAAWDGTRWCSFGNSTFDGTITAMKEYKGELYISGGFSQVDGQPCRYFARWVGKHDMDTCSTSITTVTRVQSGKINLSPNPAEERLRVTFPQSAVRIELFNATGQSLGNKTTLLFSADMEAVLDVSQLSPGWYLLSAIMDNGSRVSAGFVKS